MEARLTPDWHVRYLGRSFHPTELNCGTLVQTVLREQFAVEVPIDWGVYPGPVEDVQEAVEATKAAVSWHPVELGSEEPGDVCEFTCPGAQPHVAIVIQRGVVLHVSATQQTQAQPIAIARRVTRLAGIWRHPDLA